MNLKDLDVVYMVKDAIYNDELKYSMRSVDANFPHHKVWLIGGRPIYIHPDEQIIVNQKGKTKWDKVRAMLELVGKNEKITEDFVLFNDDFFVMHPTFTIPTFAYGTLEQLCRRIERKNGNKPTPYTLKLEDTIKTLERDGLPTHNFELHVPMILNRRKLLKIIERYPDTKGTRSLYGNTYLTGNMYPMKDVKIFNTKTEPNPDNIFLSTEDLSFSKGKVGEYIRKTFPNKSRWER